MADFTQMSTAGGKMAILSAGFDVRAPYAPVGLVGTPENLTAKTNGSEGVTKLWWKAVPGAISYLIRCSPHPFTEESRELVAVSPRASREISGAVPGQVCWFRVAAIGTAGTSPWSAPAQRPVL